jgi:uncharacterized protein
MTCPICQIEFDERHSTALPFCSKRCKQIDLSRWLGEEYGLPIERDDEDDEPSYDE